MSKPMKEIGIISKISNISNFKLHPFINIYNKQYTKFTDVIFIHAFDYV